MKSHFSAQIQQIVLKQVHQTSLPGSAVFINGNGQPEFHPWAKRLWAEYLVAGKLISVGMAKNWSYRQIALAVGISTRQLMNWKKDPDFMREVLKNQDKIRHPKISIEGGKYE